MVNTARNTSIPTESKPIIIGPRLRAKLRRELHLLIEEWNFAGNARRREITKVGQLIVDLLREGQQ